MGCQAPCSTGASLGDPWLLILRNEKTLSPCPLVKNLPAPEKYAQLPLRHLEGFVAPSGKSRFYKMQSSCESPRERDQWVRQPHGEDVWRRVHEGKSDPSGRLREIC